MINATFFKKPYGRTQDIEIKNIYKEDAEYINDNNINVSMDDPAGMFVIYFDDGTTYPDDDDTPDEIIELSNGRSCEETIKAGVEKLKKRGIKQ